MTTYPARDVGHLPLEQAAAGVQVRTDPLLDAACALTVSTLTVRGDDDEDEVEVARVPYADPWGDGTGPTAHWRVTPRSSAPGWLPEALWLTYPTLAEAVAGAGRLLRIIGAWRAAKGDADAKAAGEVMREVEAAAKARQAALAPTAHHRQTPAPS